MNRNTLTRVTLAVLSITAFASLPPVSPLCDTEDATNCVWVASISGNGTGQSFIDINGVAHYLP